MASRDTSGHCVSLPHPWDEPIGSAIQEPLIGVTKFIPKGVLLDVDPIAIPEKESPAYREKTQPVAENEPDTDVFEETASVGGMAHPLVGTAVNDLLVIAGPYCGCEVVPEGADGVLTNEATEDQNGDTKPEGSMSVWDCELWKKIDGTDDDDDTSCPCKAEKSS